jgi:mRNA interferase MazF
VTKAVKAPSRGDVVILDFNPQAGHEQAGKRPALVISADIFNATTGFIVACPITSQIKGYPFEIPVAGAQKTTGVILSDQFKSLDWRSRGAKVVDSVDQATVDAVVAIVAKIIQA